MIESNEIQATDSANLEERCRQQLAVRSTRVGHRLLGVVLGAALVVFFGTVGCHKTAQASAAQNESQQYGADPAAANMATGDDGLQQDSSQQPPAPIVRQAPSSDAGQPAADYAGAASSTNDNSQPDDQQAADVYDADLTDAQASDPPPPLPDYDQPPAPDPDYLWTPGYWAWGPGGYYWVPGYWVAAPYQGALWTPGYWSFYGGFYRFHHGYWGLHIGYYGGVDYGYGYVGHGYYGGYWNGGHFFYNTTITRVNVVVIRNVYVHPVVINNIVFTGRVVNHVSFNGGRGGIVARPLPAEVRVLHEQRIPPMATQIQAQHAAAQDRRQFYSQNHGRPATFVAPRPIAADRVLPAALPRPAAVRSVQSPALGARQQHDPQPRQFQPQTRPAQPQPEARPVQPSEQPRSAPPERVVPQPQLQSRPEPQPQARPQQEQRPQEAPQPQAVTPQARPAPQPQPRPKPRPEPNKDEKNR